MAVAKRYVAFIDNVKKRKPVEIVDKQVLSRASVESIADYGHAWIVEGSITKDEVRHMFNRPADDVLVYDAYGNPRNPFEPNISITSTETTERSPLKLSSAKIVGVKIPTNRHGSSDG